MVTAAMVTSIERVATKSPVTGKGKLGANGNGRLPRNGNGHGGGGPEPSQQEFSPDKYRIGMWVALAAIMMMFTALVSAYVVLASTDGWRSIPFPKQLWLSTTLILVSSLTFKKSLQFLKKENVAAYSRWLKLTLVLGLAFLGSQLMAWLQLIATGIQLAGNSRALFYLLTGLHGTHVVAGVAALSYLSLRKTVPADSVQAVLKRQSTAAVVGLYWHFMSALWVCLFLLLFFFR
jgi:cytochrome c oxidase subunit III